MQASAKDAALVRPAPVRGTQSFVHVMQWCWQHPIVIAFEVLWRWLFGAIALWLLWREGLKVLTTVTGGRSDLASLGLDHLTVTDPMGTAARLATAFGLLWPPLLQTAIWLGPLLLVGWLVFSTLGRMLVLRGVDRALVVRPVTLGLLQLIRVLALAGSLAIWFAVVSWAARIAISGPLERGGQPQLVEYFAIVIVGTLTLFCLWAIVSWALSLAPVIAVDQGSGAIASLRAALRRGPLRLKLVEINLVTGIIKIALIVLAMVFSACPLPFESVETPGFLLNWTLAVGVLYLIASDFFHVARLVAYLRLWRVYRAGNETGRLSK